MRIDFISINMYINLKGKVILDLRYAILTLYEWSERYARECNVKTLHNSQDCTTKIASNVV